MSSRNLFIRNYQKSWLFLKDTQPIPFLTALIFIGAIVFTLITVTGIEPLRDLFSNLLSDLVSNISSDDTSHDIFLFILGNNIRAMTTMILLGFVPFLFIPVISLIMNGGLIAYVFVLSTDNGMSIAAFLAHILPHGIIELPLMILSCSLGFYLCLAMIRKIIAEKPLKTTLLNICRVYLFIIIPGTILAALIESYITPVIGGLFI